MKKLLSIVIGILGVLSLEARVKLPAIIGNGMVLQQQAKANLWGWSSRFRKVTVRTSWDSRVYTATAGSDEAWKLQVQTPAAGGPFTITFSDGEPVTVTNVLIGEVWLCSGQSNMEMPVKGFRGQPVQGSCDAIATASPSDDIRMITLDRKSSPAKLDDCTATPWMESGPAHVPGFSATAYFFARYLHRALRVPVGVICSCWGGSRIESWIEKDVYTEKFPEISLSALARTPEEIARPKDEPTLLYNAMIHPIRSFTIAGTIWYQGESNVDDPQLYKKLFPAMVASWRQAWNQGEFPFYYVQIAPYDYGRANAAGTEAAEIRQVQLECLKTIPNAGMAVTSDIGHRTCIHPSDKASVGKRLALWALAGTYRRSGTPCSGPLYKSFTVDPGKAVVTFDYAEMGMTSYDREITGFEIAGKNGIYHPAKATLSDNRTQVVLTCEEVPEPVSVKYGFKNYEPLNLFSNFGLPASPFITR